MGDDAEMTYRVIDLSDKPDWVGNCQICSHRHHLKTAVRLQGGSDEMPKGMLLLCEAHWEQAIRYVMQMKNLKYIFIQEPLYPE